MAPPNVLLVVLDSVRAHNCSLHGHDNETTPVLESLAERGTAFNQARAPSIHSVSSHASIFSGFHVPEHDVTQHESSLDPTVTVWHELATEHGHDTGIFTPNAVVTLSSNLNEAFETTVGAKRAINDRLFDGVVTPADLAGETSPGEYLRAALGSETPVRAVFNGLYDQLVPGTSAPHDPEREHANVYIDAMLEWVDERDGPWAACLNLMDAHYPYVPEDEHDRWGGALIEGIHEELRSTPLSRTFLQGRPWGQLRALESLYDGCIHQVDAAVDRVVQELRTRGELDDTLLVVTSDHGEGFGERSRVTPTVRLVDHSWGLHERLTHVPLVVFEPGQYEAGDNRRVTDLATLQRFPAAVRAAMAGESAADAFVPDGPVLSSTYCVNSPGDELPLPEADREPYFGPWRAVYRETGDSVRKFVTRQNDSATVRIRDARVSYRVADDDVEEDPVEVVDGIYSELDGADVALAEGDGLDAATEHRLEELGYLR